MFAFMFPFFFATEPLAVLVRCELLASFITSVTVAFVVTLQLVPQNCSCSLLFLACLTMRCLAVILFRAPIARPTASTAALLTWFSVICDPQASFVLAEPRWKRIRPGTRARQTSSRVAAAGLLDFRSFRRNLRSRSRLLGLSWLFCRGLLLDISLPSDFFRKQHHAN